MAERRILVVIEANGRYCDNLCPFMSHDAKKCQLFGDLTWHHKKKTNGNIRPAACRKAEKAHSGT